MAWRPGRGLLIGAFLVLAGLLAARALVGIYTEALWYAELGYGSLFWRRLWIGLSVQAVAGVVAAALVLVNLWVVARQVGSVHVRRRYGNLEIAEQVPVRYVASGMVATALLAGWWLSQLEFGGGAAIPVFAALRGVPWELADPLFGRDAGFYVFTLPVLRQALDYLFVVLVWSLVLVTAGYVLVGAIRLEGNRPELEDRARLHLGALAAALMVLLAVRFWLARYQLVVAGDGIGGALGYTDVHARLPALAVLSVLALVAAAAVLHGAWRRAWLPPVAAAAALLAGIILLGAVLPSTVQKFQVEPNERSRERPYIAWNLEFTRRAYGLDGVEREPFTYRAPRVEAWQDVAPAVAGLPLWDRGPLRDALQQRQSFRAYYRFLDVDFDRYGPPGEQHQVAIAVRELIPSEVPQGSQTWQSLKLNPQYVRGLGAVVTRVASAGGTPDYWLYDLPQEMPPGPVPPEDSARARGVRMGLGAPPSLALTRPSIFFGEGTREYVILVPGRGDAFMGEAGEDFPGGVPLSSFWRVLAFAWRFGDKNLLFSGEISRDARILFRRRVTERVEALAPFVLWQDDSYPVIHRGRVVWLVEGYTASTSFPLAAPYRATAAARPVRYLRNSVKATVDAVSGEVALYAVGSGDPILRTYARVFPDLIRPLDDMPDNLRAHLRYPAFVLQAQGEMLERYHLTSPDAFYGGEDVWQLPREAAGEVGEHPYQSDYALMPLPGGRTPEFLLSVPLIARDRQNMTAFLVARNDPPHYGELRLVELPRDQLIPGPSQIRALMQQDPDVSRELTLWSSQGSTVDFGHTLVVPVDSGFLYVQPLFLSAQASGQRIPELARVVVSDGRRVGMGSTLEGAVEAMVAEEQARPDAPARTPERAAPEGAWTAEALDLLLQAEERLRAGDFAGFGARWAQLRRLLERAAAEGGG
ncbi:MAG TPA: UPF0182 family protein [Longimicrobiales bacterium]|nr:UPF0182 family protein [Longimicrobiales bacterium]